MYYNWEEIFKEKTYKELYAIYCGKTTHDNEAISFAEKELQKRNFDFENSDKQTKKWELENLLKQKEVYNMSFQEYRYSKDRYFSNNNNNTPTALVIAGIIILMLGTFAIGSSPELFFMFIIPVGLIAGGVIAMGVNSKKEKIRNERIEQLKKGLNIT
ncbi:MAG: hypothetical protein JXL97_14525 [Bacteroidales bacterium]|nr:hypothetical protein [Bacteroidales bacterium]